MLCLGLSAVSVHTSQMGNARCIMDEENANHVM